MSGDVDPWRDLAVEITRPERDQAESPTHPGKWRAWKARHNQAREDRQHRGQQYADEWREFSQQPGIRLSWVRAGVMRREVRTADGQTIAWLRYGMPVTVSAGGRTFTWRRARGTGVSRPGRPLLDEAGTPILYTSGRNLERKAGARITFPDQRWLRFPVRGTEWADAIMTAVDQDGNKVARYRLTGKMPRARNWTSHMADIFFPVRPVRRFLAHPMEITIHPGQPLTDELVLAIAISTDWLSSYFVLVSSP
jgi:hypothetical protein